MKVDPSIEENQRKSLAQLRKNRDQHKADQLFLRLADAAKSSDNLMPLFIECVENDLTLGEICGVLRQVWGEYQPPVWG